MNYREGLLKKDSKISGSYPAQPGLQWEANP
jgi:hypothetical protein